MDSLISQKDAMYTERATLCFSVSLAQTHKNMVNAVQKGTHSSDHQCRDQVVQKSVFLLQICQKQGRRHRIKHQIKGDSRCVGASNSASLTKDAIDFTAGTEALGLQSVQIDFIAGTKVLDLQKVVLIAVSEELDLQ